jgi:hypothetical protein
LSIEALVASSKLNGFEDLKKNKQKKEKNRVSEAGCCIVGPAPLGQQTTKQKTKFFLLIGYINFECV